MSWTGGGEVATGRDHRPISLHETSFILIKRVFRPAFWTWIQSLLKPQWKCETAVSMFPCLKPVHIFSETMRPSSHLSRNPPALNKSSDGASQWCVGAAVRVLIRHHVLRFTRVPCAGPVCVAALRAGGTHYRGLVWTRADTENRSSDLRSFSVGF